MAITSFRAAISYQPPAFSRQRSVTLLVAES
jgi:hypothetical protein